jgi:hypothetical protein
MEAVAVAREESPMFLTTFPALVRKCICFLGDTGFAREPSIGTLCFELHSRFARSFSKLALRRPSGTDLTVKIKIRNSKIGWSFDLRSFGVP